MKRKGVPDVSKALFMDLAFLLIAALVLLVRDPAEQVAAVQRDREESITRAMLEKLAAIELRTATVTREVLETALPGQSLFLRLDEEGHLFEIPAEGDEIPIPTSALEDRINEMPSGGERVVVLVTMKATPYMHFADLRDSLQRLKEKDLLTRLVEIEEQAEHES